MPTNFLQKLYFIQTMFWKSLAYENNTFLHLIPPVLNLLPSSLPKASLLRYVPLVLVLAPLLNLVWHSALELVLPLAIKDN